mmetsp:Transcript_55899/g.103465  ORF Transcript_55899/g.103465 Transcript_55899/m.103465 type:complete len:331 (+) Transcript_55899:69-1061(+)
MPIGTPLSMARLIILATLGIQGTAAASLRRAGSTGADGAHLGTNAKQATEVPEHVRSFLCKYGKQASLRQDALQMLLQYEPQAQNETEATKGLVQRVLEAKKCAVVSSSGVLLEHKYGPLIDAADLVLRFNDAPVGGEWSESVGSRDDIRILNHKSFNQFHATASNAEVIYLLNRNFRTDSLTQTMIHMWAKRFPNLHFSFSNEEVLMGSGKQMLLDYYPEMYNTLGEKEVPTTGYYGVMLMMTLCDEVAAYGFPDSKSSHEAPFHYYGSLAKGSASINVEDVHRSFAPHEKLFYDAMALNSQPNVTDLAVLPGFAGLQCDAAQPAGLSA